MREMITLRAKRRGECLAAKCSLHSKAIACVFILLLLFAWLLSVDTAEAATYGDYSYEVSTEEDGTQTVCITKYSGDETEIEIPIAIDGYAVTSIGEYAFSGCNSLTNIVIPEGVTSIGESAFRECGNLTNIKLPESITTIGWYAFHSCRNLTDIMIPEGLESIGVGTFAYCESLTDIALPKGVTGIGGMAFHGCSGLTSITIPEGVTSIEQGAFSSCSSLTDIALPKGVTGIGYEAFQYCRSLVNIVIPESVISIGIRAFNECNCLSDVYYSGSKKQWDLIDISAEGNDDLTNSIIHYSNENTTTGNDIPDNKHEHTYTQSIVKTTTTKNGLIKNTCTACGETNSTTIYYPKTISLSATSYTYNGKARKPTVKVTDSAGKTISQDNYTVSYTKGCKNVGRYNVKITFKGNYSGSITKMFDINPKGTSISKVAPGKKGFTVKWKKQGTQTTGYQIQCSTNKSFKGKVKSVTIGKNKTVSKKVTKLKAKTKYYVRVRTYTTAKVGTKNVKFYSEWSKAKSVKTKK